MRSLKNILRRPGLFLPLIVTVVCLSVLGQVGFSAFRACREAEERLEDAYSVTLQLSLKEKFELVVDPKTGRNEIVDANTCKIDTRVLGSLDEQPMLTEISRISKPFQISLNPICSKRQYESLMNAIASGEKAISWEPLFYGDGNRSFYDINVVGCDDAFLEEAIGTHSGLEWTDSKDEPGVILPYALYTALGEPEAIVAGWYSDRIVAWLSSLAGDPIDQPYEALPPEKRPEWFSDLLNDPPEPAAKINVRGFYHTDDLPARIVCDIETWEQLYRVKDYYELTNGQRNFYRDSVSALNEVGLETVSAGLISAGSSAEVIRDLMASGLSADSYSIVADDYAYQFARAQLRSMQRLFYTIMAAIACFSVLMLFLISRIYVKRRGEEVYLLRTLGEKCAGIQLRMTTEYSLTALLAVLIGIGVSQAVGSGIGVWMNQLLIQNAELSAAKMTEYAVYMKYYPDLKQQAEQAMQQFSDTRIMFDSSPSLSVLFWQSAGIMLCSAIVWFCICRKTHQNLMDRSDF